MALQPLPSHLTLGGEAVEDDAGPRAGGQSVGPRAVAVDDGHAVRGERLQKLPLGGGDGPQRAQPLQVHGRYGGDDPYPGRGDAAQEGDVPPRRHPHLQDGRLVPRLQAGQGEGEADLRVQVPGALQDAVAGGEDGRYQLLAGGLAHAARDPYHLQAGVVGQTSRAQPLQRLQRIAYLKGDDVAVRLGHWPGDHQAAGAAGHRLGQELVAVVPLARQGEEELARGDAPRVDGHVCEGQVFCPGGAAGHQDGLEVAGDLLEGQHLHLT
ncbi:hypothetical protein HRbin25_00164 [bacterium HR25]|nr:hypothetical protein HRbin25_00164 [bacterium HR25]